MERDEMKGRLMSPREIAVLGIMSALVAVMTFVYVPIPATKGFFNLGESMIFFAAFVFGKRVAGLSGAIGAGIVDYFLAPIFLPATILIKFTEGYVAGSIFEWLKNRADTQVVRAFAVEIGGSIMVIGYFVYEAYVLPLGLSSSAGLGVAIVELPWNISQAFIGGLIAILLATGIEKSYPRIFEYRV